MNAKLLEGKVIAEKVKEKLKAEIRFLKEKTNLEPKLKSIQIGEESASSVYVKSQEKTARALGIEYETEILKKDISEKNLTEKIKKLNRDEKISAIIVHFPLPKQIDPKIVMTSIEPAKDAEGVHPENLGRLFLGNFKIVPCTPLAVIELIESTGVDLYGKEAVIVGHSDIVGKPMAILLLNKFATTTVCHIATGERGILADHVKRAEILVVAVGKAGIICGEWIKKGAIVIDVGFNKTKGNILGDVEFEGASERASFITPVPGGVGPLTTAMLMKNTIEAFKIAILKKKNQR